MKSKPIPLGISYNSLAKKQFDNIRFWDDKQKKFVWSKKEIDSSRQKVLKKISEANRTD